MTFIKNKKGYVPGFFTIFGIISLLLAGGIIIFVLKGQSTKLNERLEIDLCRISNEISFGLKDKSSGTISGPQICKTIDKTRKKNQIPTKKYSKISEGAATEVRDMIRSCWHMWLDGSVGNMFEEYPVAKGCFTCYTFKIKDKSNEFDFETLSTKMSEPFFAKDTSKKCTQSESGGFWKTKEKCEQENGIQVGGIKDGEVCCLARNNECENKGGECFPSPGRSKYDKWACSSTRESCYVKDVDLYSYTDYIRGFGQRGGEIIFIPPPDSQSNNINYVSTERYAISFVSPNKGWCGNSEEGCWASINDNWYISLGTVAAPVGAAALVFYAPVVALAAIGTTALNVIISPITTGGAIATGIYFAEDLTKNFLNLLTSAFTVELPNFMIVSTQAHAEQLGCTINPGQ